MTARISAGSGQPHGPRARQDPPHEDPSAHGRTYGKTHREGHGEGHRESRGKGPGHVSPPGRRSPTSQTPAPSDPLPPARFAFGGQIGQEIAHLLANLPVDATELLAGSSHGVGYLLKDRVAEVREFVDAVVRVAEGGTALDPEVVAQLLGRSRKQDVLAGLTPREREVLGLMAEGRTNSAIARQLVVSDGAVEKHVSDIFLKLGLSQSEGDHRRVLAVLTYLNS